MRGFLYAVASVIMFLLLFPIIFVTIIVVGVASIVIVAFEAFCEAFNEV